MRIAQLASVVLSLVLSAAAGTTTITPTTTLAAETGNNTSAADTFTGLSNGSIAAGNVSKMPIRSLLYAGANTKIYTHLMPWFGGSNHISVGYDSSLDAQAARQVQDMVSRGIDGVIVDWYGPNSTHHNTATKNILKYAEKQPNFQFAICEDWGAVKNATDPQAQTISDLNYAWLNFMQSPAYLKQNGQPVITFFGFEGQAVDMAAIKAALTFNPIFIMRNSGGFTEVASDGSFSWLAPLTSGYDSYMSLPYLDGFYATGVGHSSQQMFGSGFKGFNDTLASWAPPGGRHIPQFCGQTWLSSFAEAGKYFTANNQLPSLQIVTWNDYEEGTAIESGIDNCVSITSWMSGSTLNWAITGQESTVDHYTVYASLDGTNLANVGDFATGSTGVDIASLNLAPANYQFFVKAVGKASMANHMSSSVAYSVLAAGTVTSDYSLSLAPLAVQVARGSSASVTVGVKPVNGAFNSSVSFSCGNLPANVACNFSNGSVVPGSGGASTTLTISAAPATSSKTRDPFGWMVLPAFGFVFVLGSGIGRRVKQVACVGALLIIVAMGAACGSGVTSTPSTAASNSTVAQSITYNITITATSGSLTRTTTASVTVQ